MTESSSNGHLLIQSRFDIHVGTESAGYDKWVNFHSNDLKRIPDDNTCRSVKCLLTNV